MMAPSVHCLISNFSTPLSSFPQKPQLLNRHNHHNLNFRADFSRRDASFFSLLSLVPSIWQQPAPAMSIGFSGPKDWLKEQKRKTSKFLLAPIDASRESLRSVYLVLTASDYSYSDKDLGEVQRLSKSAARDCIPEDRNSFVAFQANTGVEVCTFRLVVNNASSLLDDKDPLKLEAEAMLNDLIRSFTSLNSLTNSSDFSLASGRLIAADAVMDTISSLNRFEQGVLACLA